MEFCYDMEELLPIVKELSEKCTSKESTSVTYEKAQQLMEAVIYCINEIECYDRSDLNQVFDNKSSLQAREAYQIGYELVLKKVQKAHDTYNEMILSFCSYGNIAYKETIEEGLTSFFQWYDPKLNPQNHIILADYPLLLSFYDLKGIDFIFNYIICVELEQKFLMKLSKLAVIEILNQYHSGYEELIVNVCGIVMRKILICMLIDMNSYQSKLQLSDYKKLEELVKQFSKNELTDRLEQFLYILIKTVYDEDKHLFDYLKKETENITVELINAVENNNLINII